MRLSIVLSSMETLKDVKNAKIPLVVSEEIIFIQNQDIGDRIA